MKKALVAIAVATVLAGCGAQVEVPPASVGKILTRNGYAPDTVMPSKFRLEPCIAYCDKLVTLQVNDNAFKQSMVVFMPEDKLNLTVEVRGTFSIPNDSGSIDAAYDRITPEEVTSRKSKIDAWKIFEVYGVNVIRGVVRSELTKHRIKDVLGNREALGASVHDKLVAKLKEQRTPLAISRFQLADIQPPQVIVQAQIAAKEREVDIQRAEADAQIALVEAERALEVAKADRLVEREKAEAIAEQNTIAANSITPQVLEYKRLEAAIKIWQAISSSNNSLIVPADTSALTNVQGDATFARMLGRELKR